MRGDPLITSMWNNKDVMEGTVKKLNPAEAFKILKVITKILKLKKVSRKLYLRTRRILISRIAKENF